MADEAAVLIGVGAIIAVGFGIWYISKHGNLFGTGVVPPMSVGECQQQGDGRYCMLVSCAVTVKSVCGNDAIVSCADIREEAQRTCPELSGDERRKVNQNCT